MTKGVKYYFVMEAGAPMSASALNWVVLWSLNKKVNICYQINGGFNRIGSDDFLAEPDI